MAMLLKDIDDKTLDLDRLHELFDRADLSPRQRDDIFKQMDNIRTGYRGEKDAAHFLNDGFMDGENTVLIHDLRLEHGGRVAQIDHLLIHRVRRAYVLETKSLNANLACNDAGEWTAWYGPAKRGTPRPIPSPIEQARRHVSVLDSWFKANGVTRMERIEPVVIVSPTSFVTKTRAPGDEDVPVIRADLFKRWWLNSRNNGAENLLGGLWRFASAYSAAELIKIGELLVANHRPIQFDWEARFGVRQPSAAATPTSSPVPRRSSPAAATIAPASTNVGVVSGIADEGGELPSPPALMATIAASIPAEVETQSGIVTIKRVTEGQYALRHAVNEDLAELVRRTVQDRGRWQPRYRNWLVAAEHITAIAADLRTGSPS